MSLTPEPVQIRPRLETDLPALARLLVEVHERDGYPVEGVADPEDWLRSDQLLGAWVAELDGEPVGHVVLTRPGAGDAAAELWCQQNHAEPDSVAVMGRLFVSSQARGLHLGQRLSTTALQGAEDFGRRAVLDVMAKDTAAIRVYESLGWVRLAPITHTFGDGRTAPAYAYVSPPLITAAAE